MKALQQPSRIQNLLQQFQTWLCHSDAGRRYGLWKQVIVKSVTNGQLLDRCLSEQWMCLASLSPLSSATGTAPTASLPSATALQDHELYNKVPLGGSKS
jgi:hypothetical protein